MDKKPTKDDQLLHNFKDEEPTTASLMSTKTVIICIIVILLGVGAGFALSRGKAGTANLKLPNGMTSSVHKGDVAGSSDTKTYKDTAEGVVRDGGVMGDGQFHLERPGGETQTVALTSSLVDLSQYVGHTVKVWGQTQQAQKAAWLMDVRIVEVQK